MNICAFHLKHWTLKIPDLFAHLQHQTEDDDGEHRCVVFVIIVANLKR